MTKNGNFLKFMMADGRHFENSFIYISQPWSIRFWSNLVHRCKFPFRACRFEKNEISSNSRWRTGAILIIVFLAISRRLIGRLTRNSEWGWRITCRYRSRDQNGNVPKFMMADGRDFENSFRCLRHSCNELMLFNVFQ